MREEEIETLQAIAPPRQNRILVVDDEAALRSAVASLLEQCGYCVSAASGAESALRHLQDDPGCALVLADILMPGGNGLALLDDIGRDHPGLPVVMLSGVREVQVAINAFRRGAADYLLKPFERAELIAAVARTLEQANLRKQTVAYRHNLEEAVSARTGRLRATMHELEKSYDFTLEAMGEALDLRDAATEGHSRRVTAYSIALARELGVCAEHLRTIARGAFLHDIGKIATPDHILLKPGKLDPDEIRIMRQHCTLGYEMVRKIPFLRDASEIVHAHQETYDGTGYPRGLRGEDIPLGARIFAIADTLDAMTSDRPYRKSLTYADARAEIQRCSGTQFDPRIVQAFLRMPETVWHELRREVETSASRTPTAQA